MLLLKSMNSSSDQYCKFSKSFCNLLYHAELIQPWIAMNQPQIWVFACNNIISFIDTCVKCRVIVLGLGTRTWEVQNSDSDLPFGDSTATLVKWPTFLYTIVWNTTLNCIPHTANPQQFLELVFCEAFQQLLFGKKINSIV